MKKKIAVLIPCYNEGLTIGKVVRDFRRELPEADIVVYDNNSTDNTVSEAVAAGAIVDYERQQGKGCVVRSMFRSVEADVYVMVDGDDTYPASSVHALMAPVLDGVADMAIGDRLSNGSYFKENTRPFHGFGNNLVRFSINQVFHARLTDIMTGYRCFSHRFVRAFPVLNNGFQLETEMTIFALNYKLPVIEVPIDFTERPDGSVSKLNTFADGRRVLACIFDMYRHYRPLAFFSSVAAVLVLIGLVVGIPPVLEFVVSRYVSKVPSTILASALIIIALLLYMCGLILDSVEKNERQRIEQLIKQ
ncbi:MAG: glycosyltransferase [Bacteroidales bacterium]|nr:glycosyltransferase [Bacteroidales bacterium]